MSNKKKNKLDIIQGQSPLYVLFLNNNEGCTKMHVEDIAISVKEIFPSFSVGQNIRKELIYAKL